jgi:hypothetical protein
VTLADVSQQRIDCSSSDRKGRCIDHGASAPMETMKQEGLT